MKNSNQPNEITINNERSLKRLVRSITNSQGNFALILACCNYAIVREQIVQQIREKCPIQIRELYLSESVTTLYTTIQTDLGENKPQALMVFGLEQTKALDQVLTSANQVREEFRKEFPFPIVLWVTNETLQRLTRLAPDFKSWAATSTKFAIEPDQLVHEIQETVDATLTAILSFGVGKFLPIATLLGSQNYLELEPALSDLREKHLQETHPQLEADLRFLIGREVDIAGKTLDARCAYEQSLAFWRENIHVLSPKPEELVRYACVSFHLGLWWRRHATLHPAEIETSCLQAKDCYQQGIKAFQQSDRPDLAAKFINALAEVLLRLEQWDEIEILAPTLVKLHETHSEPIRLAYGYSFLAELALQRSDWQRAKKYAELALQTNDKPSVATLDWQWDQRHYRNLYLLLLARSQQHLNQTAEAITNLETAKTDCDSNNNPLLYIRILETLWGFKFEQGAYWDAFQIKQEQRSIEQQYGLRAFVGAGRLQTRRFVANPAIAPADDALTINQEIAASGRLRDIRRLVDRMSRADHKLTVIYGQSGVGKSSLVQAGLLPVLKQQSIEARDVIPVLLQVYSDWAKSLGRSFAQSFEDVKGLSFTGFLDSMAGFLSELRSSSDNNFLTVLIFDQFEEFFFAYRDATQRRPFFEFLRDCLEIPYVKVILSLREDYLHYLLECNRLTHLDSIDNNILDKKILYYLGNFSPEDAKSVIKSLTEISQFNLEADLIDLLVQDLAGDLGEVRPIELQVVGAQLQTEKIKTLAQYEAQGPKERLVGRFLEEVVKDCGPQNEQFAKLVLYLLTDENNTRPLKTRAELEADLALEPERLDLILRISVKSGLVFQVPGFPAERYQLVHDYLVPFIRQEQSARLIAELEKEKEQRKLTEEKLNRVLKQQLKSTRRATITLAGLVLAIGSTTLVGAWFFINLYLRNLSTDSAKVQEIERVQRALKAGRALQRFSLAATPETRLTVLEAVTQAVNGLNEVSSFRGHTAKITSINFSQDEQTLVTSSEDGTARLWNRNGKPGAVLQGHSGVVSSASFSLDGQRVITTGVDKTARLWTLDGNPLGTFSHPASVVNATFSSNGQIIVTGSSDGKVRLWNLDGKLVRTLLGHTEAITSISFSSDDKFLTSASEDDTIRIWTLNDSQYPLPQTIENYGARQVSFSPDDQMVVAVNKDGTIKFWKLDGTLLNSVITSSDNNINSITDFSFNGKIAIGDQRYNPPILIRDVDDTSSIQVGIPHTGINVIRFSPMGNLLASADSNNTVQLWSVNQEFRNYYSSSGQVRYSSDGESILTTHAPGLAQLWSKDGSFVRNLLPSESSGQNVTSTFFTTEGKAVAAISAKTTIEIQSLDGGKPTSLTGFSGKINQIRYSPDGQTIAAIGNDNTLVLWSKDGALIKVLPGSLETIIDEFEFAPDGQRIATYLRDGSIHLWDSAGQSIQVINAHKSKITKIVFSPDSQLLVSIDQDSVANLWDKNGSLIRPLTGHLYGVKEVLFSPDSQLLASIGADNLIGLWNRSNNTLKLLPGHPNKVASIIFSPNSQTLASLSSAAEGGGSLVKLWDRSGSSSQEIDNYGISRVYFAPSGRLLATIQTDKTIRLWDLDGTPIKTLRGHNAEIKTIDFSHDSQFLASGSLDNTVRLWQVDGTKDSAISIVSRHPSGVYDVQFSPDDKALISVSTNYDDLYSLSHSYSFQIHDINQTFNSNSKLLYSLDGKGLSQDLGLRSGDLFANTATVSPSFISPYSRNGTNFVQFSASSHFMNLVSQDEDSKLSIQSVEQSGGAPGKLTATQVRQISFSPDGRSVVWLKEQSYTLRLWDFEGKSISTIADLSTPISSVSLSPDGQKIAIGNGSGVIEIRGIDGRTLNELDEHTDKISSVIFSPDGKLLASASEDKTVRLWRSDGTLIGSVGEGIGAVHNILFNPNSKTLTFSDGNELKLWDLDGNLRTTFQDIQGSNLQFNPSNSKMLITDYFGYQNYGVLNIQLFNGMWQKVFRLAMDEHSQGVSFSPDGKKIAIVDRDGKVSVLELDPEAFMQDGCEQIRDYLENSPDVSERDSRLCDEQ